MFARLKNACEINKLLASHQKENPRGFIMILLPRILTNELFHLKHVNTVLSGDLFASNILYDIKKVIEEWNLPLDMKLSDNRLNVITRDRTIMITIYSTGKFKVTRCRHPEHVILIHSLLTRIRKKILEHKLYPFYFNLVSTMYAGRIKLNDVKLATISGHYSSKDLKDIFEAYDIFIPGHEPIGWYKLFPNGKIVIFGQSIDEIKVLLDHLQQRIILKSSQN